MNTATMGVRATFCHCNNAAYRAYLKDNDIDACPFCIVVETQVPRPAPGEDCRAAALALCAAAARATEQGLQAMSRHQEKQAGMTPSDAASVMGKSRSPAQTKARQENGRKGGRPRKQTDTPGDPRA